MYANRSRQGDLDDRYNSGRRMTGDMSKNKLVKLGYDPRIEPEERRRFFIDTAIPQLSHQGAINALKLLIIEVKSLEKGVPNILKSMKIDLYQLGRVTPAVRRPAKANTRTKRNKRENLPKLPQPAPTSLKISTKCAECSSVLGAGATVRIYGKKVYGLYCHTKFIKDRPTRGHVRLTTGQ